MHVLFTYLFYKSIFSFVWLMKQSLEFTWFRHLILQMRKQVQIPSSQKAESPYGFTKRCALHETLNLES